MKNTMLQEVAELGLAKVANPFAGLGRLGGLRARAGALIGGEPMGRAIMNFQEQLPRVMPKAPVAAQRSIGSQVVRGTGIALGGAGLVGAGALAASPELQEQAGEQWERTREGQQYMLDKARSGIGSGLAAGRGALTSGWNSLVDVAQSLPHIDKAAFVATKAGGSVASIGGVAKGLPAGAIPAQPVVPRSPSPKSMNAKGSSVPGGAPAFIPGPAGPTGKTALASFLPSTERALELEALRTGRSIDELRGSR